MQYSEDIDDNRFKISAEQRAIATQNIYDTGVFLTTS